jgi:hypothetical protein
MGHQTQAGSRPPLMVDALLCFCSSSPRFRYAAKGFRVDTSRFEAKKRAKCGDESPLDPSACPSQKFQSNSKCVVFKGLAVDDSRARPKPTFGR